MSGLFYRIHDISRRIIGIPVKLKMSPCFCHILYKIHYKIVNKKLSSLFFKSYKIINSKNYENKPMYNSQIIWMFWWQGYSDMPKLVYGCINSVFKHSNNHHVVLITKKNILDYAKIPKYIYYKLHKGYISLTHFSDILRFNLLKNYGGLWIDSTLYCRSNIPSYCFKNIYTTQPGYQKYAFNNISCGRWTGFLIGGISNNKLFLFMTVFFSMYWELNNHLIDYFLIDYALNFAYNMNIGNFKYYINNNIIKQPNMFKIMPIINKHFNYGIYSKLSKNTIFFKMSYKKTILRKKKYTFYDYFLNSLIE